jgi:hypothetical protein
VFVDSHDSQKGFVVGGDFLNYRTPKVYKVRHL